MKMQLITGKLFPILRSNAFKQALSWSSRSSSSESDKRRSDMMNRGLPKIKPIKGVKHILMVASGKGGVGKTTTAVNLACAMKMFDEEKSIGLLDADVFGPSVPLMMNIKGEPMLNDDHLMEPLINYGVKCMSMGLLVSGEGAVVWRGLMVMQALERLTRQVDWGSLDCLVIDTPPGTGDTHLSLAQNLPIDGAIIVTTPQMAAIQVTRRGANMLQKLKIPMLGIVENMAHSQCQSCGAINHIFGENTAQLSKQLELPLLESFPLHHTVSESTAYGVPIVVSDPTSEYAIKYMNLAGKIYEYLKKKDE